MNFFIAHFLGHESKNTSHKAIAKMNVNFELS